MKDRLPVAISIVALIIAIASLVIKLPTAPTTAPPPKTERIVVEQTSAVISVAKNVSPSVVAIASKSQITDFFGLTRPIEGAGTGFIITADGMIATNRHVVEDPGASYTVVTSDGKRFDAAILAKDPFQDLAVLKIDAKDLQVVDLGDSDRLQVGEWVVAIGNALGQFQNTVTAGVLSGKERSIEDHPELEGLLQTDAAINPGNSGGPLVNLKGQVIGINTAVVRGGAEGLGFAIPINNVKKVIDSVKKTGRISRPFVGIRYIPIDRRVAALNDLPVDYGVFIIEVTKAGPAEKAGLKRNDIILEFDGKKITQDENLARLIAEKNIGDKVGLKVLRSGKESTVEVTLEEFKS